MWSKITNQKIFGMLSPPLVQEMCKTYANYLESYKTIMSQGDGADDGFSFGIDNMPISRKNCSP